MRKRATAAGLLLLLLTRAPFDIEPVCRGERGHNTKTRLRRSLPAVSGVGPSSAGRIGGILSLRGADGRGQKMRARDRAAGCQSDPAPSLLCPRIALSLSGSF